MAETLNPQKESGVNLIPHFNQWGGHNYRIVVSLANPENLCK